jgi:YVTN family beta-propeller protein
MRTNVTMSACAILIAAAFVSLAADGPSKPSNEPALKNAAAPDATAVKRAAVDRSPVDLVLAPDDTWLVTVNQTSNTASLVRTSDGQVLDEVPVGQRPAAVALCPDGRRVLISGMNSGEVTMLEVAGERLRPIATIHVGFLPVGIAVTADGRTAYVALSAVEQVAVLDLEQQTVTAHIEVGRWPRYLALSPDGSRLAVGVSGDRGVAVVDTATRTLLYQVNKFKGLNVGHMQISSDGLYAYFPWMHYGENVPSTGNIRRGWVLGNRVARVRLDGLALREAISLDKEGHAVGDAHGLAISADEQRMIVTAAGTHEVLVFRLSDLPYSKVGGTEHIDPKLLADPNRFSRITVGGRPMGVRIASDNKTAYVANYLENSVQVIDLETRELTRSIALGSAPEQTVVRRGEAIFYDAQRSFDQWYSCHSCHYDGGTSSEVMDTLNDGSQYTFKTVLSLYNVHHTPPWTWHGWQTSLEEATRTSITQTMIGREPTQEDVGALVEFIKTLELPPNPFRQPDGTLTAAAERGKLVFESDRAGCANCHNGPHFTDGDNHPVGLVKSQDRYKSFNTPSLLGVYGKVRLLHDGRARTLDDLLTGPHNPSKVTGQGELTDDERRDLIEYLKSL